VGDMQGAVFGGLLECPLKPTAKRKYQVCQLSFFMDNASLWRNFFHLEVWFYFVYCGDRERMKLLSLQLYMVSQGCFYLLVRILIILMHYFW